MLYHSQNQFLKTWSLVLRVLVSYVISFRVFFSLKESITIGYQRQNGL